MDANRTYPARGLKSDLGRFCLPPRSRPELAWVNSICIFFLLIGLVGAKPAAISRQPPPALVEVVPAILEPTPPPPATEEPQPRNEAEQDKQDTPRVVVVTQESPSINFAVPTIGNLVAPSSIAQAPPLAPMKPVAPLRSRPTAITTTGNGGERPAPPYPKIAVEQGEQGSVTMSITVDDAGNISQVELKESSGSALLDRTALEYVKKHWIIPPTGGSRHYQSTITFQLRR
jgi:protein TonB